MKQSFPFFSILSIFLSFTALGNSSAVPFYEDLPQKVKEAVSIRHHVTERKFTTDLNGNYQALLKVDLEIETRNRFLLYQDNFSYQIQKHETPFKQDQNWQKTEQRRSDSTGFLDPVSKKIKQGFKGQNTFSFELKTPPEYFQIPENYKIPLIVNFQACSERQCLLPQKVLLEINFFHPQGKPSTPSKNRELLRSFLERSSTQLSAWLQKSGGFSFNVFLILFLAGLLTAFTPCVYPIYPITLGIFSRWTQDSSSYSFLLAIFYCLGMTLSYAAFGLVTAATGSVFGALTQQPFYLISIGAIFLLSAIFFSGMLNFPVPAFLQNFFGNSLEEGTHKKASLQKLCAKASFMGLGMGVVAAPCVGPILLALLAWLSQSLQNNEAAYLKGFFLLSTFGIGMSLPFLILGHLMLRMKKKISLGRLTPWAKQTGTLLLVIGSLFFIIPGIKLLSSSSSAAKLEFNFPIYHWETQKPGKWTIYDFRADWCVACLKLETQTFVDPKVSQLFESEEWQYVQIDLTKMTKENKKITEKFKVISLPSVFIINPKGEQCKNLDLHEFEEASQFLLRMNEAKRNCSTLHEQKDS